MKKTLLIVSILFLSVGIFAQAEGDYRTAVSGFADAVSTWETFESGSWVAASSIPGSTNDVTVLSGHTLDVGGSSSISIHNLTVESGAVVTSSDHNRSVTIYGATVLVDGDIDQSADAGEGAMFQVPADNIVTFTGSGSISLYRIRTSGTGATIIIDIDMTVLRGGGIYLNNKANCTLTVNEGKTVNLTDITSSGAYIAVATSKNGNASVAGTFNINGTVNVLNSAFFNISNSNVTTLNVGSAGSINFDSGSTLYSATGTADVNIEGVISSVVAISFGSADVDVLGGRVTGSGSGTVTIVKTLVSPSSVDILGAKITSAADLGLTTITAGFEVVNGIDKYYIITPATNAGLNATLVFNYDESELNGIGEADLAMFSSPDGETWTPMIGSVDESANTVTVGGINSFERITLGDGSNPPLPVELASFTASSVEGKVNLSWETATEVNNYGFEIERKSDGTEFEVVGQILGAGNSNTTRAYSFVDEGISAGKYSYRLKQIDIDGKFSYSTILEVEVMPASFGLDQNFPNPFNPSTKISYSLASDTKVTLKIYDILGAEVLTLVNETQKAGAHTVQFNAANLPSGVYIYRLQADNFSAAKKLVLLK